MSDAQDHTGTPPAAGGNPTPNSVAAAIAGSQQPQQQNNLPQATTQSVSSLPATTAAQPSVGSDEVQNCAWKGCNQHFPSAAALYEHLCEQHIGRKSTNNLNLICQWGTCTTSTVKRDHITSHMRVHVPLKPHKCDFCGKSFKRPQDLKKHVKTHADDSVLMRSPDPPRGGAPGGAGYRPAPGTLGDQLQNMASAAQGFYGGPDLGSNGGYGAAPNAQSSAGYYSAPQGSSYGPVYYNAAAPESYESKKRLLIEALSEFFGEVKNKPMNASSYNDISTRLSGLAGVEIPVAGGGGYGGGFGGNTFGGGPAVASNLGHGHARDYALPLPTVKNRNDLSNIDHFLDQLQTSMMENENQAAAAGVAQAGTHYVHPGVHRSSHSPTEGHHAAHPASTHMSAFNPMTTTADSGTPALTPASSVTSYAAGQSPGSVHSHHSAAMSHGHRGSQGNMSMYPNLPSIPAMADPSTSAGPTANLGATYDDSRRRFNGNMLQKAAPPTAEDAMDVSPVTSRRNSHEDLHKDVKSMSLRSPSVIDPAIDPALGGGDSDDEKKDEEEEHRGQWLSKVRTIETMREIVRIMIDEEIYPGGRNFEKYPNYFDHEDEATTPTAAGPSKYPWSSNDDEDESSAMDEKKDEDPLYPRLRAALDSDNV